MSKPVASSSALAAEASSHFFAGDYDRALTALRQLQDLSPENPAVQHNVAVTKFYKTNCTQPQALIKSLEALIEQQRDTSLKTDKEDESGSFLEVDTSLFSYNLAVLHYQLKQYSSALALLEALFVDIEAIDDYVAVNTCFLLLETLLQVANVDRATAVVAFLEKIYPPLTKKQTSPSSSRQADLEEEAPLGRRINSPLVQLTASDFYSFIHIYKVKPAVVFRCSLLI